MKNNENHLKIIKNREHVNGEKVNFCFKGSKEIFLIVDFGGCGGGRRKCFAL